MSSQKKVIIWGSTGAIGTELAQILSRRHPNWTIKATTRSVKKQSRLAALKLRNVVMIEGDPFDEESVVEESKGCDIIYSCLGFHKYQTKYWAKHWPLFVDNLLQAVTLNMDSRLVFCDNLYAYGAGHSEPITTSTLTVSAHLNGKPNIRCLLRQKFQRHMYEHPGTMTVVGGSDFFGPYVTSSSFLGDTLTGKISNGENALAVGSATKIHDFCYSKDFANALAVASIEDKALDKFWICPHSIHGKSLQEIANDISQILYGGVVAKQPVQFSVLTEFLLDLMSPVMDFAKEMTEMMDFWNKDYSVDDSEFCQTFGVKATAYDEALGDMVDFYYKTIDHNKLLLDLKDNGEGRYY